MDTLKNMLDYYLSDYRTSIASRIINDVSVGEKVVCVKPYNSNLVYNKEYTISHKYRLSISVKECSGRRFFAETFKKVN